MRECCWWKDRLRSLKRCLVTRIPWGSIHFNVIAVESARLVSLSHRVHHLPRDSEKSVHHPRREVTCDSFPSMWRSSQVEFESRVEAGRQTPATSLDHEQPRPQLQNNKTYLEKHRKNLRPGRSNPSKQPGITLENVRPSSQRRHHHRRPSSKRCPRPIRFPQRDHWRPGDS
jgi:hypothetical protein